ncbi:MAG: hypothetical protein GXO80_00580 [Chlorobi bacterium]|nr:hypothetical protein [Chlorobiota bacterium]
MIQGIIKDIQGEVIPRAIINEIGTENKTTSDLEGNFILKTIHDSCSISFSFIGLEIKTINFTKDSTVNVTLEYGNYYNSRWLTIGTNYGFYSSVFGFQLSNGTDEEPLIHFEEFQDKLLIKIQGQTDFDSNYSYRSEIGWSHPIHYLARISCEYTVRNYESTEFYLKNFNLSSKIGYFRNTLLLFKVGYTKLQERNNFGITIGIEQNIKSLYFGFSSGYYSEYFYHNAYLQIGLYKNGLFSFRATYDRINNFNLLTLGIHYTFVRNNNR